LAVSSALAVSASAAEPLDPDGAAALAVERHPLVRAADREIEGARADRTLARSGWLPRLDLTEDFARSTNPVYVFASKLGQEDFGPEDFALDALNTPDPLTNAATRILLRQNVWDGGRTTAGQRAARQGLAAAEASRMRTRDEIAFGARRAFWDAALADELVAAGRAAEEAASANASLARDLVEEGIAIPSDRMQAEARLGEVRALRVRAEQGAIVARAALARALGAEDGDAFELEPHAVEALGAMPGAAEVGDAIAEALTARPDLAAIDARLAQAEQAISIARSERLPQIGLGAQYEWNASSPFASGGNNWTVGAALRIPIYDGSEAAARQQRARADRDRLAASAQAMRDGVALEIRSAAADGASAAEAFRTAAANVALTEEALRIVRERYGEGLAVVVELLGAEAAATQARTTRARAVRDLAVAHDAFTLAIGRPLHPSTENQATE
jgi:outer membrane protein TolC